MTTPPPALLEALQKKDLAAAERALAAGESAVGWQSLSVAIEQCLCDVAMVDLLLRHGTDPNEVGSAPGYLAKMSALHCASWTLPRRLPDAPAIIRRLLEAGANPRMRESGGKSCVWVAAARGSAASLACLLPAVSRAPRKSLESAMEAAFETDEAEAKVTLLLAAGVQPNAAAIVRAFGQSSDAIAQTLLARGMDVNACDANGCTPLHRAVERGHVALVDALLARGASLTAKTKKAVPRTEIAPNDTPVMVAERAARTHHTNACPVLLREVTGKNWQVGAIPSQHPATVDGGFAAAVRICASQDRVAAESLRNPSLREGVAEAPRVRDALTKLANAEQVAQRVGASLQPSQASLHGKWTRLYVGFEDEDLGRLQSKALLELKKDGTFAATLHREKLTGTFTHDSSAKAPLTLTTDEGPLQVEFDGAELRITRPTDCIPEDKLEGDPKTCFVFGPPK